MNRGHCIGSHLNLLLILSLMGWTHVSHAQIAPPFTTLYNFNFSDGANPVGSLTQGKDGSLYGTTEYGGAFASLPDTNPGTLFKITTTGKLTTLYSFGGDLEGIKPIASLMLGTDGDLYGTTDGGGSGGNGMVFKITTAGALTYLFDFGDGIGVGANPLAGLVQGLDGNLYGTTATGGPTSSGTVFKIGVDPTTGIFDPGSPLTDLYSFSGDPIDGANPWGNLIQTRDGNLYGTTLTGGANNNGTVFKITASGALTTLYSFSATNSHSNNTDGRFPAAGLIQGKDGNLYGTTYEGGLHHGGTVFKITTSGVLTTLYSFSALDGNQHNTDGYFPYCSDRGLALGRDGALYGTTEVGGANGNGTVFRITTSGALTTLYTFSALTANGSTEVNSDGAGVVNGLIQGKDGNLYGTASQGGANGDGTVFKLTMVPVIISFSPAAGRVGSKVTLTGFNFTEAVTVRLGSVKVPKFTINSDTSITFMVPAVKLPSGAEKVSIAVTNKFGTGVSGKKFIINQ